MVELEEGEKWLPLAVVTIQINISLGELTAIFNMLCHQVVTIQISISLDELTAIFNMLCHQVGGPPPCPALRGGKGRW